MVRLVLSFVGFLIFCFSHSQVGIGTITPNAKLDIVAATPASPTHLDGLLIPRIERFSSTNPTSHQHGMLVFLAKPISNYNSGFYFWDEEETDWTSLYSKNSANFYKSGTTISPNNINDPIYRSGNIGIGIEETTAKLQIAVQPGIDKEIRKGAEIDNNNQETANFANYGLIIENRSATNGAKYGIKNNVSGTGAGVHYGIFTETYQNTGTNDIYGIFNRVGRTYGARSNNYGIYSQIGTNTGSGNIYGIYSTATGDHNANVFAGYFAGRVGIGLTPEVEYVLPASRGKNEQVLVAKNSSEVTWEYPNKMNYTSTGTATGNYIIPDEVYTLRINAQVSSITLPEASQNRGRILILIGWPGSGTKNINFLGGDTLFDIQTGNNITTIGSTQRLMIQSIGTRWAVLFK